MGGVAFPLGKFQKTRQGVSFFACASNRAATGSRERLLWLGWNLFNKQVTPAWPVHGRA